MELGPKIDELINALTRGFVQLCKVANIKSAGGRTMLAVEFFLGLFLLVALAMEHLQEIIAAVYSWLRGTDFAFASERSFLICVGVMLVSLVLVTLRELMELYY